MRFGVLCSIILFVLDTTAGALMTGRVGVEGVAGVE